MRLALSLIRVMRRLAPAALRDRWCEEWQAEIAHAAERSEGRRWSVVRVWRFALGAIPDLIGLHRLPRAVVPDRGSWLSGLPKDFRHAARNLWGAPGFTATVVASLSLGVVVVTGAYAFITAAMFPTLPGVADQDRLIEIRMERSALDERAVLRDAIPGVRDVASTLSMSFAIRARNQPLSVRGALVSANYFDVLGTRMRAGRGFLEKEDRPAGGAVAVLASTVSRRLFGDENPLGAFITVGGHPVQIVGVAEDGFRGINRTLDFAPELWVPFGMADTLAAPRLATDESPARPPAGPGEFPLTHVARVSSDASVEQAVNHAMVVAPQLIAARLGTARPRTPFPRVRPVGRDQWAGMAFEIAAVLLVPCLVLLIGCINAATLLLARGTQRARDIAVRLALGAGRWRIVRHLLAESMLLALVAAAVTLPVLSSTLTALERVVPLQFDVDLRVAGFAVLVSFASVIVFGLAPAMRLSAARGGALGSVRVGEMPRKSHSRQVLVAVQVALSLGLLATGGQLISAVRQMSGVTGAIDPPRLLMVSFDLSQLNAPEARTNTFYQRLLERVERLPGVQSAGLAAEDAMWTFGMGMGDDNSLVLWPPGEPASRGRLALGGYTGGALIETVGLGLEAGRLFTPADRGGTPRVAIVNRSASTQFFGGAAVGRRVRVAPRNSTYEMSQEVEIVGVVEPALDPNYVKDPADPTVPAVYLPERLQHQPALALYVRTREDATSLVPAIQHAAASFDPLVPVLSTGTLAQRRYNRQMEERLAAQGVTLLGVLGLALASGGLYGMVAFIVALKRREIGIRMALGARPRAILQLMLAQGMTTALAGAAIGGAIALASSVVLRSQVFRVPPIDFTALLVAATILVAVVLVASVIPARAASRVDPLVVLREE
jgi:predicted permease